MGQHKIHFSHANGLPAGTYRYLFEQLDNVQVCHVDRMGHGDYPVALGLYQLADELIAQIEQQSSEPVIGMGHSAGGIVTLLAGAKRPDLFKKVIVLDPVLLSKRKRYLVNFCRLIGLGDSIGPIKRTIDRRSTFKARHEAKAYFAGKTLFKNFHPRCFDDYIQHGLMPTEQGFELAFSKWVEADIFRSVGMKVPANLEQLDGVLIYGKQSHVFERADANWWRKHLPNFKQVAFEGEHLFPLEQPDALAQLLNRYI